jgi:hypothetical protein
MNTARPFSTLIISSLLVAGAFAQGITLAQATQSSESESLSPTPTTTPTPSPRKLLKMNPHFLLAKNCCKTLALTPVGLKDGIKLLVVHCCLAVTTSTH